MNEHETKFRNAEYALLAAMIAGHCKGLDVSVDELSSPIIKELFTKILELQNGEVIDLVVLNARLSPAASACFINNIMPIFDQSVIHGISFDERISNLRLARKACIVQQAMDKVGIDDPDVLINEITKQMSIGPSAVKSNTDIFKDVYRSFENAQAGYFGLRTGFKIIDDTLMGLHPGRLYIVSARSGMGKSAFVNNIALNVIKQGKFVYMQALEETAKDFCNRMMSNYTKINYSMIQRGDTRVDAQKLIEFGDWFAKAPLVLDDTSGLTAFEVCSRIKNSYIQQPIDLIIVDHILELKLDTKNKHNAVTEALGLLKDTAKKLKVPIIVVAQINREAEKTEDKRPKIHHLKESGSIEEKANAIILLYRDWVYNKQSCPNQLDVGVAKNRDGQTGGCTVFCDLSTMTIRDV